VEDEVVDISFLQKTLFAAASILAVEDVIVSTLEPQAMVGLAVAVPVAGHRLAGKDVVPDTVALQATLVAEGNLVVGHQLVAEDELVDMAPSQSMLVVAVGMSIAGRCFVDRNFPRIPETQVVAEAVLAVVSGLPSQKVLQD
jgi:hypothetical protein